MGHLFLPKLSRPLPPGAVVTDGVARWRTKAGKVRTAESRDGRIYETSAKWVARYRDGEGVTRTVATGCKDESAARAVLVQLERRSELVRAGIVTPEQDAVASHRRSPIAAHVAAYLSSLAARGTTKKHRATQKRLLETLIRDARVRSLADLTRERVENWLVSDVNAQRSARTKNCYVNAAKWLVSWCVQTDRVLANPLLRIARLDEKADRRRQPRAFTVSEIERLIDAAARRPVAQGVLVNRGWRRGRNGAQLRPETIAKLELRGRERALIYKTLVLTGLRLGELTALRVRDMVLENQRPRLLLAAEHEKNREGSEIPLRADLAVELRDWIVGAAPERPLFRLNENFVKVLNRDLAFAGIPKRDDRGRTACVHSLRYSTASLLNQAGVAPRTAMAALRHRDASLTLVRYQDPRLLDVAAALDALPALPLAPRVEAAAS